MTPAERRARELLLTPGDARGYVALLDESERGEYHVICPGCRARLDTYEATIVKHARSCEPLRRLGERS